MKKQAWLLLGIFWLALLLRLAFLGQYPHSLNRDEAAIGYNAYSLMKTGRGEHGEGPWPMNFVSFGDYKMPGLVYFSMPFIKVFGLNNFAVRLPNALLGSLTILIGYWLLVKIFPAKSKVPLFAGLFLTVAPFHIHASRMAYEPPSALFLQLAGFLILVSAKEGYLKLLSLALFLGAMFFYGAPVFLVLPLTVMFLYFYRVEFFGAKALKSSLVFLTGLALVYFSYFSLLGSTNLQKSGTTIVNNPELVKEINQKITAVNQNGLPIWLARVFLNKPLKLAWEFGGRYFEAFNLGFLFFSGDEEPFSDLSGAAGIANLSLYILPLFLGGLYFLVKKGFLDKEKTKKEYRMVLVWLALSAIPSGLVNIAPNTAKMMMVHFLILVVAGIGLVEAYQWLEERVGRGSAGRFSLVLSLVFVFELARFIGGYFFVYPEKAPLLWLPELDRTVAYFKEKDFDHLFVSDQLDLNFAYIYFAFYTPFEPADFAARAERKTNGFNQVGVYDKYVFSTPPGVTNPKADKEFKEKYGETYALIDYRNTHKFPHWQDEKIFYFNNQPLWVVKKK